MSRGKNATEWQIIEWAERQEMPKVADLMSLCAGLDVPKGLARVLCIESLPQAVLWSKARKAKLAEVAPRTYYNWLHDPRFAEHAVTVARRAMGAAVPEVMAAFIRDAGMGNASNQARILEQVALIADSNKKRIEFDDVSKAPFDPALSKEVAAVLAEAADSGATDDDDAVEAPDDDEQ